MTATYDLSLLAAADPMTSCRTLLGDTNMADPLLQDEEINYFIATEGPNVWNIAWHACEAILARMGRQVTRAVGAASGFSQNDSDKFTHYHALAERFKYQANTRGVSMWAAALTLTDKEAQQEDDNRTPPAFTRELFTYPGSENPLTNPVELPS